MAIFITVICHSPWTRFSISLGALSLIGRDRESGAVCRHKFRSCRTCNLWAPLATLKTSVGAHSTPRCGWNPWKDISHQEERQYHQYYNSLYFQFLLLFSSMVLNLRPSASPTLQQVFYHTYFTMMKEIFR